MQCVRVEEKQLKRLGVAGSETGSWQIIAGK